MFRHGKFFFFGGGQLPLPRDTTPLGRGGVYAVTLLPETPGTRVPEQIPNGYLGTKIPESPSTNDRRFHIARSAYMLSRAKNVVAIECMKVRNIENVLNTGFLQHCSTRNSQ